MIKGIVMKKYLFLIVFFLLGMFILQPIFAEGVDSDARKKSIETNLIMGIHSDNEGLRISSAYYLGEIKSNEAVFPLMKMLREESVEAARIMAALSLIKIEDPQGLFMVKRTAKFNDFERVRKLSEHFYNAYLVRKYMEQHKTNADFLADL